MKVMLGGVPIGAPPSHLSDDDEELKAIRGFIPSTVWRDPFALGMPSGDDFPSAYVPAGDITAFGTQWGHNQGPAGVGFGPPGYPALDSPNGIVNYASKNCGIVSTNTFKYNAGKYTGGILAPAAVIPSATGFRCRAQLAWFAGAPFPGGAGFQVTVVDSAGQSYNTAVLDLNANLPAVAQQFVMFSLPMVIGSGGNVPASAIWITGSNATNPPNTFILCSFVEVFTA